MQHLLQIATRQLSNVFRTMFIYITYKILHYDRYVSEVFDANKSSASKECVISQYWCFLDIGFKFRLSVCHECRDKLIMSIDINSTAILNIRSVNYCCIINGITKSEAISLLRNADFSEKTECL